MFYNVGIDCKYYNAQKITKETMNGIGNNIYRDLKDNKVEICLCEQVVDIKRNNKNFIITTNKREYYSKFIIIAVGRIGSRQLIKIADKIGIKYVDEDQQIEIGIRVEMPFKVFDKVNNIHNDIKLKLKIGDNEELRSFCQDYKGYITRCVYNLSGDKIVTALDGHIIGTDEHGGKMSDVVNIAVHHRYFSRNSMSDIYEIISKFNHKGKPIVQAMKNFMTGNGSITDTLGKLSMVDVEYGDINKYLPLKTAILLKNFIFRIDRVLPGFADDRNVIYAPSFEMGWKKMILNRNLETTVKNIYIGGDVTGHFRGAMQSAVSGVLIARNLLKIR